MAKKSFSSRKSLRNLFSKSEANLKESVEKDDSGKGSLKLFKWKKKKKTDSSDTGSLKISRTESGTLGAGDGESQDGEESIKRKKSLFGSVLRSKKDLLSSSETDLHKPKGFAASLSWRKNKKKKRDLSQGLSSNSDISGVKDHISEQEEYDDRAVVEQNQLGFEAAMPTPELPCTSDQYQSQDVLSDMSTLSKEDASFKPSDLDSTSIQFIDSSPSDSDVYQTPPDSPFPEYLSSDHADTQAADRSAQCSTAVLSFSSQAESDLTDSFSPDPIMKTAASTDTCTVHNSSADLNPKGVSGRDDQLFSNSDFEVSSKSGILADVEVKSITTVQKESYLEHKESKDATDAVHQNYIDQSSISSISESSTTSIPQSSLSSTTSTPQNSISSISVSSATSIPQNPISSISESSTSSIPENSISSMSSTTSIPQSSLSSTTSMPQNSISSTPQNSISSISVSSTTSIPQNPISSISESSTSSIPENSISSMSSTSSISQSSIYSISESSTTSIPQNSISSISESSTTSIPQNSITSISESSTTSIPQNSITSISESFTSSIPQSSISSTTSIPQNSISSISESSTTSIPKNSITSISESFTSSIPQSSISSTTSIPQNSISSISESSTTSIPKNSITSISESFTSSIPQSSISSTSFISQNSISSISESSTTSIPKNSISSISESSTSSIPENSISSMSSTTSIPQSSLSSTTSMPQNSISSTPQNSISSISVSSTTSIPQNPISSISESSTSSIPENSISSMSSTSSISQSSIYSISESSTTSIPQNSISSISESSTTSIPQNSITSISESFTSSIPQSSISSTTSIPQNSISSISESSTTSIPKNSITSISESFTSSIPQSSISSTTSIPQNSISSISESSTTSIPKNSITSISESFTSSIPQSSISSTSFISQNSISSISESSTTSIPKNSITSISESFTSSIPQSSISSTSFISQNPISSISESSTTSIPQNSISSISESSTSFISQNSISSISESSTTSIPQNSISSISESFTSSIPQSSISSTTSISQNSISSISESSTSSISQNSISSISSNPQSSTSIILDGFTSNITSNSNSAFTLERSSTPPCIKSAEAEDSQTSTANNTNMSASSSDTVNTDPSSATTDCFKSISVSSMPDVSSVSYSRIAENSLNADTDVKPILSFSSTDVSVSDLSSVTYSLPTIPIHSTSDSSYLEETHPEINYEESHQTDNYSSSTFCTDQDETTAECMTTRNGLQMSVKNLYGPEVEEGSRLDTDFHYKCHFASIQEPESIEIITAAESMTTRNDLHMFGKDKYEREVEDIYHERYDVSSKVTESEQIMDVLIQEKMLVSEKYEVEEQRDELQMVQSTRETSATQGVCEGTEVLTGQAEWQIHRLAPLKPALPVNQECGSEECTSAPPISDPVKVSPADSSMETHSHLEIRLHPLAQHQPSGEITILEDTARCKYQTSPDNIYAEREEHTSSEEAGDIAAFLTRTQESESQEHSPGTISTAQTAEETFRHSDRQGEVTVTKVKTARDNITHRNWVQISESTSDDRKEKEDTAEVQTFPDQLLSRSLIPGERFFHASTVLSTVIEESDTQNQAETEPGSDSDMNSGVAVFSTKLNQPSSAREDAMVVRKVSLVSTDKQGSFGNHESPLDSMRRRDEAELERKWKSLHYNSEEQQSGSEYTDSTYLRSSQLSPSYEKGVYTSHFHSAETQPTAFSSETDGSLGNTNWKVVESEVHRSSESYTSGRGRVELSLPEAGEGEIRNTAFDSRAQFDSRLMIVEADDYSSDVFQATRVDLIPSPTGLEPDALSPSSFSEMDNLVDTLKSMERPVRQRVQRTPSNTPFSSLPPIDEDAPISPPTPLSPLTPISPVTEPRSVLNGVSSLPLDIGFNWSSPKDMRSPLTMMKEQQFGVETQNRGLSLPLRASALNSIVMRKGSLNDLAGPEDTSPNGPGQSRLENSFFFQPTENGKASNRSIFRAASLPEIGPSHDRMSSSPMGSDTLLGSRFERFSYLTSPSNSLSGIAETSRISVAPPVQHNSQETSIFNHKSTSELYRSLPSETLLKNSQSLPRSSSLDGGLLFNDSKGFQMNQTQEPERNLQLKYRAFPDAYLTKEKEHGKLNPRPGKMLIFDKPGLSGDRIEVRGDVVDATPWEFTDTISIRVIRGGWVLYEKPDFKGEKIALDEGDIELTNPFGPDEEVTDQQNGTTPDHGEEDGEPKPQMKRKFVIGSIRRAVRDYSVPEISLFPEENAEGKKVTFRDTSEDSRIFGFPIKANSIIINAGLWLVFAEPFFQGVPRVLEVGGFSSPAAWGVTHPYVASVHPLKIGEPRVENLYEPKIVLYEKPYFTGKSREIYSSTRDFLSRVDRQQSLFMFSAGSIKVIGGCWVGYEKEGFRGYQYLLEEGEYHDWRVWGGVDSELRSVRVIQADLSEPLLVLYGMPDEEKQEDEERTFEVTEAVPDVELFGFGINTRSIHVLSGAWVAYSHVDFSGNQYVLEKGFYNNCSDWGSGDNRICSIQPILAAPSEGPSFRNEVLLYSEPDFQGSCRVCHQNQSSLPESLSVQSCRVVGGSWVLYGEEKFTGNMCVLSEGDYPNLTSMGVPPASSVRSVKAVPMTFSVPSISLFGLECFEGREVTIDTQVSNMQEEGFNTHFLSVRVNSGCWVLCEHSNYRGRQFLLEPIEITSWHKFSSVSCIGSLYPVRQKQRLFRIRNKETGHCISVQGGVEDMKTGRVVVSEQVEGMSDVWLYQDGLIKNKLARTTSLQVMGNVESGAKVVLWTETRVPVQTWSAQVRGRISSNIFPGMVLDIKGGKTYDKQHLVIREENEESESQQWELEFV
ncbi:serine-rich adhesin for platelets isoform X2 [Megalobrama amblycephala]|uniref:serine-rich adhesin for platelets isoform X2 n=1 Tax=Megalobrama amblycephala TaxID=75352 RepID=UPI00201439F2|nr:serine-rich adhesin for platelets isoform X2 [Megalobrama amblycephala]